MDYKKWLPYAGWFVALILGIALFNAKYTIEKKHTLPTHVQEHTPQVQAPKQTEGSNYDVPNNAAAVQNSEVPSYVLNVLEFVTVNGHAKEGYVGGRTFYNREKQLPKTEAGKTIAYREWDVHPKINGKNRGAERVVTGDNNTAFYTQDHYRTFIQLK